jgi:hypothetical protein
MLLDTAACVVDNPFYVLALPPDCSRADIERQGQKLLGMLELRLGQAATYATPLGPQPRTGDKVRQAMAHLRDPQRRLMFEVWARIPADAALHDADDFIDDDDAASAQAPAGWPGARRLLGWGP